MDIQALANIDHIRPLRPNFIPVTSWESSRTVDKTEGNASFLRAARAGNIDKVQEFLKNGVDINTSNANGLNALHLASKEGHIELVQLLLNRGASVDAATKKGNTALHIACLAGQGEIVKILIDQNAAVNVQSQNGFTPLYMAAQENHFDIVKHLIEHNANQSLATEDGFTPLAVALQQGHDKVVSILLENDTRSKIRLPALHIAAKKDDVKAATLLLETDHNADVTSKSGFTPLHIAAHYGNVNIANLLLDRGANVNFAASKHSITPLHVAAKWGRSNMVTLLLERGAEMDAKTRDGLTPLHCGARSGHDRVVDILLQKSCPNNPKTKNGLAPLHMAAQGDHVDSARALLYYKAPVDDVTVDYLTPLHVAAHCGHVRVAKLLLDRRADANARALNGFTPLHIACKKNRIKVVELLLKHGASIEATTESGLTPLHVASFMGCMNIVLYLIQHGANPDVTTVRGETPLHLAVRSNQTDIIRILLRNGAKVDAKARENQTPLHIATRLGHMDNVAILMQHGAVIDVHTKDLYTPLHIAAKEGQEEVASRLIEQGASLTAATRKGFTPLHLAAKYGHLNLVRLFLLKGAPVDSPGKNGVTPLHVAAHYDNVQVAQLLLENGASPHASAKNGYTPLHISAKKNQMDIASSLLKYKANPNAQSKAGFTPVHLAAQEGNTEMLHLLLDNGGDVNARANNGLAPLHLAAQEDQVPIGEILVDHKAEINPETKAGYTPLHVASHFGQMNMVRFLLAQGADVNVKTSYGYTPLHQAAQQGQTQVINVLLQHQAQPNEINHQGQTALSIAEKLGYISVVETLKVVTETIVTTTTTTVTEEKFKVVAPETMQEAFISDSEDEAEHLDEDDAVPIDSDNETNILRRQRVSQSVVPSDGTTIVYEEHVYETDLPDSLPAAKRVRQEARSGMDVTVEDDRQQAVPSAEQLHIQRRDENVPGTMEILDESSEQNTVSPSWVKKPATKVTRTTRTTRARSPDYLTEFAYENSAAIPQQDTVEQTDEQFMEHVSHDDGHPSGSGISSDFKQYEHTVREVSNIESRGFRPINVPDVVVVSERTESRSGYSSPMLLQQQGSPLRNIDSPMTEEVVRYELVAPPEQPTTTTLEKPAKKRHWFSFGSGDKDKPVEKKKSKSGSKKNKSDVDKSFANEGNEVERMEVDVADRDVPAVATSPTTELRKEKKEKKSKKKSDKNGVAVALSESSTAHTPEPAVPTVKQASTHSSSGVRYVAGSWGKTVEDMAEQAKQRKLPAVPGTIEELSEHTDQRKLPGAEPLTITEEEEVERYQTPGSVKAAVVAYERGLKEKSPSPGTEEHLEEDYHYSTMENGDRSPRLPNDGTVEELHQNYHEYTVKADKPRKTSRGPRKESLDEASLEETAGGEPTVWSVKAAARSPRVGTQEQLEEAYQTQEYEPERKNKSVRKDRSVSVDSPDEDGRVSAERLSRQVYSSDVTETPSIARPRDPTVELLDERVAESQLASPVRILKPPRSPRIGTVEKLDEAYQSQVYEDEPEKRATAENRARGLSVDSDNNESVQRLDERVQASASAGKDVAKPVRKGRSREPTIEILDEHVTETELPNDSPNQKLKPKSKSGITNKTEEEPDVVTTVTYSEDAARSPVKSALKGSTSPRLDGSDQTQENYHQTVYRVALDAEQNGLRPKKLSFRSVSVSSNSSSTSSGSSTSYSSDSEHSDLDENVTSTTTAASANGKLRRKPHVKKIKKVKKEKVVYQSVPTDERLDENVTETTIEGAKKSKKDKSKKKSRVIVAEPLGDDDDIEVVRESTEVRSERNGGRRGTSESLHILQAELQQLRSAPGTVERLEANITTNEIPEAEEAVKGKKDLKKIKVKSERAVSAGLPVAASVERLEEDVDEEILPAVEKKSKKTKKEKKPKVKESKDEKLVASVVSETKTHGPSDGRTSKARNGSAERHAATPEPEVVIRIVDMTGEVGRDETEILEKQAKAEKEAQKQMKKEAKEREKLEKQREKEAKKLREQEEKEERAKSKEHSPKPVAQEKTKKSSKEKTTKEKTPTSIDLTETVRDSGLEESPVQTRSPSQPFSPIVRTGPSTTELLEQAERQQRAVSPGATLTVTEGNAVVRSTSALSGRSRSPMPSKTVVDLYEKVTKETLANEDGGPPAKDAVDLYETPWLPLNRDEDFEISTWEARKDEPAVSPPDFHNQLHYMQEETPYPAHLGDGEVVYASGYSEGKMSPQVEAKVVAPRIPVPPIVVTENLVHRQDIYAGQRKQSGTWQKESYEQILQDVEVRKHEPNYHAAVVGHEPEVRDDLHELEGSFAPDNVDLSRAAPIRGGRLRWKTFLVSFLVDARGGAMRGCRHSGVRVIIPPRKAACPMRITCKYLTKDKITNPPPLMEGEGLACRVLEMGPLSAKFLGPVIVEIPHFASLRDTEREIIILRSENGQTWREHTLEATEDAVQKVLNESFDPNELSAIEDLQTNRIVRILTTDFPLYFAVISRIRQEVHAVGPDGGIITSTVENNVQALFPEGALTKKIKVGVQAHVVPADVVARLLGNQVAVSPIVTVEPRRRKFHKPITLTIPLPRAAGKGMVNKYTSDSPNLRLLCSITGGTNPAQWEDITGSTPLVIVNNCIQFTTTVSARFWLVDCGHAIPEAVNFGQTVYNEACVVPFMAKFVVYARRFDNEEARLRVFCMTDDKEDKTLEHQERFVEVSKSRDVEVLEGRNLYIEMAGNLIPVTKSGEQLHLPFLPFQENRLPFLVKVKDPNEDAQGRLAFMKDSKSGRGEVPQVPLCNLSVRLPDQLSPMEPTLSKDLVTIVRRPVYMREIGKAGSVHKADVRLHDVADLLGEDWPELALQLGFRDPEIQSIKDEEPKVQQQGFTMLRRWIARRDASKPAGNDLEQALKRINRDDVVNKVMFNVKLLTDDLDKSMARFSMDRDQMGFDALHDEIGPSGTLERVSEGPTESYVRDYYKGYAPTRAESETASETGSLHEHDAHDETRTVVRGEPVREEEVLVESVTTRDVPKTSEITESAKEQYINRLGAKLQQMDESHPSSTATVEHLQETSTTQHHGKPVVEPPVTVIRTDDGRYSPTDAVIVTRENLDRASSQTSDTTRTPPPSPQVKPTPPPRFEGGSGGTHVYQAEHVTVSEVPQPQVREAESSAEGAGFSEKRRLSSTAVADDNAQKSSSQKSYEVVETDRDDEGNLVTKKTVTTVKTTRSTRTIVGDQDEIVKMATEGDFRNVPTQRASAGGAEEVHYAEEVTTRNSDNAGPEITEVTDTYGFETPATQSTSQEHLRQNKLETQPSKMALFTLAPLPATSPIPLDVDTLMREMEEPIQPTIKPSAGYPGGPYSVPSSDMSDVGDDAAVPIRPKRLQELAGSTRPIEPSGQRKGSNSSVASSKFSVRTDDQSYATARESVSEAESSEYYTAREGMSTSDSISTLKSEGGDVRQIESDVESVFSEHGLLSGSRQTLIREDSLETLHEKVVQKAVDRESTPVNEPFELLHFEPDLLEPAPVVQDGNSTVEHLVETVRTVSVTSAQPVPSPRSSKPMPLSCNIDTYNDEIDATLNDMMRSMPVVQPETYQLSDLDESEVLVESVVHVKSDVPDGNFASVPEVAWIATTPLLLPRSDSIDLEEVIRNVERTNEEMRQLIDEERRMRLADTLPGTPNLEELIEQVETTTDELRIMKDVEQEIQRQGFAKYPLDHAIDVTYNRALHPHDTPRTTSLEEQIERMITQEEDLRSIPQLRSRHSRNSITIEHQIDQQTFDDMLQYHTPTSPDRRRQSATLYQSPTRQDRRRQSDSVYTTEERTSRHEELDTTYDEAEVAAAQGASPYPGEFLRRFIAERDRERTHISRRPRAVLINPDSPDFVRQMAQVVSQETELLSRQGRVEDEALWTYPADSAGELVRTEQRVVDRFLPDLSGHQQEFFQAREYEEMDESGGTVRTYEEERVTVETRTVIRDAADDSDEYTQQVTSSRSFGQPEVEREELSEHVTKLESQGARNNEETLTESVAQFSPAEETAADLQRGTVHFQTSQESGSITSLNTAADTVVDDAVESALAELTTNENGSPSPTEELTSSSATSESGEEKTATRPTHLFAAPSSPSSSSSTPIVSFSHTVPIIETPSTHNHPADLVSPDQEREPSPVELTEEQPEYQDASLAETEVEAVVEEPLSRKGSAVDIRVRNLSGSSAKSASSPTVTVQREEQAAVVSISESAHQSSSSQYFEETVVTTTTTSGQDNRLKRAFTYRANQPGTPPGSLDIEDEMVPPSRLEMSTLQMRRLSEAAERQTAEASEEERPLSLKERVQFFEQKSLEANSPPRITPPSATRSPASSQGSESPSPTGSVREISPPLSPSKGLPPPRGGTTARSPIKKRQPVSPPTEQTQPPPPPKRQIFVSDDEYTTDVKIRDKSPSPPPRRIRESSPSSPPGSSTAGPPSPPLRQIFETVTSPPSPPHRQVFESEHERMVETVVRTEIPETEPESTSSAASDTTDEELKEVANIEEDLPSLATEVEKLKEEHEQADRSGSDERTSSPESPKEGHVRDVVGKMESLITGSSVRPPRRSKLISNSTSRSVEVTHYTMETGRIPAVEGEESKFRQGTSQASTSKDGLMSMRGTKSMGEVMSESESGHIESDVSHDFDQLAAALSQEREERAHESDAVHLFSPLSNDALKLSPRPETEEVTATQETDVHVSSAELSMPTISLAEEQQARDLLATRTMRFSVEEETAPQLETSTIQPIVLHPVSLNDETTVVVHESPLVSPTVIRSESDLTVSNAQTAELPPDSRVDSRRSSMSAAFMEESAIQQSTPSPSPPALSPRSVGELSPTSRGLASVLDRPIFGGLVFPSATGPSEKRHLYLQEKMDRSRPTTPVHVLESPRKREVETIEEVVAVTEILPENVWYAESATGGDVNDASSMAVETSDTGTRTPPEDYTASEDELRQTSFDSETQDTDLAQGVRGDDMNQRSTLHKSISFGTGPAGGVASESLLKSLAHASFDSSAKQDTFHSHQMSTTTITHSAFEDEEEVFSTVPEELELHRRMSTSSQIADKFGDTEDIPAAVEQERRRSSHIEGFEERASPVADVAGHHIHHETASLKQAAESPPSSPKAITESYQESLNEVIQEIPQPRTTRLSSVSTADAYLQDEIAEMERRFEEKLNRDLPYPESLSVSQVERSTGSEILSESPERMDSSSESAELMTSPTGTVERLEEEVIVRKVHSPVRETAADVFEQVGHETATVQTPSNALFRQPEWEAGETLSESMTHVRTPSLDTPPVSPTTQTVETLEEQVIARKLPSPVRETSADFSDEHVSGEIVTTQVADRFSPTDALLRQQESEATETLTESMTRVRTPSPDNAPANANTETVESLEEQVTVRKVQSPIRGTAADIFEPVSLEAVTAQTVDRFSPTGDTSRQPGEAASESLAESVTRVRTSSPDSDLASPTTKTVERLEERVATRKVHSPVRETEAVTAAEFAESISPADMVEGLEADVLAHHILAMQQGVTHNIHSAEEHTLDAPIRRLSAPYISPGHLEEVVEEDTASEERRLAQNSAETFEVTETGTTRRVTEMGISPQYSSELLEEQVQVREVLSPVPVEEQAIVRDVSPPTHHTLQGPDKLVVETAERRLSDTPMVPFKHQVDSTGSVNGADDTAVTNVAENIVERAIRASVTEMSGDEDESSEMLEEQVVTREVFSPDMLAETVQAARDISSSQPAVHDEHVQHVTAISTPEEHESSEVLDEQVEVHRASSPDSRKEERYGDEYNAVDEIADEKHEDLQEERTVTTPEAVTRTAEEVVDTSIHDATQSFESSGEHVARRHVSFHQESTESETDTGRAADADHYVALAGQHSEVRGFSSHDATNESQWTDHSVSPFAQASGKENAEEGSTVGTPEAVTRTAEEVVESAIHEATHSSESLQELVTSRHVSFYQQSHESEAGGADEGHSSEMLRERVEAHDVPTHTYLMAGGSAVLNTSSATEASPEGRDKDEESAAGTPEAMRRTAEEVVDMAIHDATHSSSEFLREHVTRRHVSFHQQSEESENAAPQTPEGITRAAEEVVETAIHNAVLAGRSVDSLERTVVEQNMSRSPDRRNFTDSDVEETAGEIVETAIEDAMRARAYSIDEQRRVTFDVEPAVVETELEEVDVRVNRFASPEPEEHIAAERFRPKTPEVEVEALHSDAETEEADEAERFSSGRAIKRHVSFDVRAPVQIEDEREDSVDQSEQILIAAQTRTGDETSVRDTSSEESEVSVTGTDETVLDTELSPTTSDSDLTIRRTSYGMAASTARYGENSDQPPEYGMFEQREQNQKSGAGAVRGPTVSDEDLEEFAEEEARRILAAALDTEDSENEEEGSQNGYRMGQNGSPILTRIPSESSDSASVHESSVQREGMELGERTVTRVTRTTITHSPVGTPTSGVAVVSEPSGDSSSPVVLETVTVRSTRSSVASSPASPQREFPVKSGEFPVGEMIQSRSSEDVDESSVTSTVSRTVTRTEVTTLTSTTLEGEADDSGEQIVTRITRQTITKRPMTLSTDREQSDTENDDEVGRISIASHSPNSPSTQNFQTMALKTSEPAVTTYTSIGPEVTYETDEQTVVTKVTMTTTVVSNSPSPLLMTEEETRHRGGSPSQAQFNSFIAQTLGNQAAVVEGDSEGKLDVTRTESRTDDMVVRRETQTFTTESAGDQNVVTTVTRSTVVVNKIPETGMMMMREGPTIEEMLDDMPNPTEEEDSHAMSSGGDWLGKSLASAVQSVSDETGEIAEGQPQPFVCHFPPPSAEADQNESTVVEPTGETAEVSGEGDQAGPERFVCHFPPSAQGPQRSEIVTAEQYEDTNTDSHDGAEEAPERFVCHFPPPSEEQQPPHEDAHTQRAVVADDDDGELAELESREGGEVIESIERGRGDSAQSYLDERHSSSGRLAPSSSMSMPEISTSTTTEDVTLAPASGGRGSEISDISASSGRLTSDSSRRESGGSTGSDTTLRSPGSRAESSSVSEYVSAVGSPVASVASSYRTAEGNRRSGSEYDTAATDFSSTPYQTAGEGSSPGSRQFSAVGSPVGQGSGREEAPEEINQARSEETIRTSAEISSLAQEVVKEFSLQSVTGTRRQPSWELIGPDDINDVRRTATIESSESSGDDFEHVEFEELTTSQALSSTMVESTGVVSEPETEKSFTLGSDDDDDETAAAIAAAANDDVVEMPAESPSQAQAEPDIEYPTTTSPIFTDTHISESSLHHEAADIFDMNHQVPGRRERTPDPTPELPEEKAWTKADFQAFRPTLGGRQYSESEFSEAELRDLARRGSEVSIGEMFQRPQSPEPPGSSSPGLVETEQPVSINLLQTPDDEETTFLQPLDDILEEKESSSGESDRFQQRRDVASSASGSLQEFERLEAETAAGGLKKPVPHDAESLSSLTEFERLEQQAAVEEEVAFHSPETESMTHSESMSSGTASTVVEQGRDDDVQSQQTDRDVMGDSLDDQEMRDRLSPRQQDIMTDSLDERGLNRSLTDSIRRPELGISDVLMTDSLESEGMRRVLSADIMADSLTGDELQRHLQEGETAEIQIPPVETGLETKGETVTVRRYLVTGHPTLRTATFSSLEAMQEFLSDNQVQYPTLQIYESMEEHTDNETDDTDTATTTTRIVKRRRSELKESVETVTFTGTDSSHEMAKFLSHTMPLDYNETETIECETRDETGDVTRMMTRRLSRVDVGQQSGASGRLQLRQMSSSTSIPDIPERSPNTDLPPAAHSHSTGDSDLSAHATHSLRQDTAIETSQPENINETEILKETVTKTVTADEPSIEEEGAEEIDLSEHDVKEQQRLMKGQQ